MFLVAFLSTIMFPFEDVKKATCDIKINNSVLSINDLPSQIKNDLKKIVPDIVDAGLGFNKDDETSDKLGYHRFIGAWQIKLAWIVSYEHGGMHHVHNIGYFKVHGTKSDFARDVTANLVGDRCIASKALVSGIRSSFQNHF